jgi:hypothetical protein
VRGENVRQSLTVVLNAFYLSKRHAKFTIPQTQRLF